MVGYIGKSYKLNLQMKRAKIGTHRYKSNRGVSASTNIINWAPQWEGPQ